MRTTNRQPRMAAFAIAIVAALAAISGLVLLTRTPAHAAPPPDLVVTKTNDVSGHVAAGGEFTWTITIRNAGEFTAAYFPPGAAIFHDDLGLSSWDGGYGAVSDEDGEFECENDDPAGTSFTCYASPEDPLVLYPGGYVTLILSVDPDSAGVLTNPAAGGICMVDPQSDVEEIDDDNNSCTDTVIVDPATPTFTPPPDFTVILPTATPTGTPTPSATATETATATTTVTPTTSPTPSPSPSPSRTATATSTASPTTTMSPTTVTSTPTGSGNAGHSATPKPPATGTGPGSSRHPAGLLILLAAVAFAGMLTASGWFATRKR